MEGYEANVTSWAICDPLHLYHESLLLPIPVGVDGHCYNSHLGHMQHCRTDRQELPAGKKGKPKI